MNRKQFKQLQKEIATGKRPILVGKTLSMGQYKQLLLYTLETDYLAVLFSRVAI